MADKNTNTAPVEEPAVPTVSYTQEQIQNMQQQAYIEGQRAGALSTLKQVRSEINDYISDLIASLKQN